MNHEGIHKTYLNDLIEEQLKVKDSLIFTIGL